MFWCWLLDENWSHCFIPAKEGRLQDLPHSTTRRNSLFWQLWGPTQRIIDRLWRSGVAFQSHRPQTLNWRKQSWNFLFQGIHRLLAEIYTLFLMSHFDISRVWSQGSASLICSSSLVNYNPHCRQHSWIHRCYIFWLHLNLRNWNYCCIDRNLELFYS